MAAKHENTYMMRLTVEQLRRIINNPSFVKRLDLIMRSENPTGTGVWYRLHHGTSFTSWGEKITITLTPVQGNQTQVHIHSECGLPTQVIDWGKNKQMVNSIYEYLAREAAAVPPIPQTPEQPQYQQPQASAQPQYQPQPQPGASAQPQYQPQPQPGASAQPRFCMYCGTPLNPGARFCSSCGTKLG